MSASRFLTESDAYAQERENDRIVTFCISGQGHQNVSVEDPEDYPQYAGQGMKKMRLCQDCGHDITDVVVDGVEY